MFSAWSASPTSLRSRPGLHLSWSFLPARVVDGDRQSRRGRDRPDAETGSRVAPYEAGFPSTLPPSLEDGPLTSVIRRFPLVAFFVLAFALTWPFLIADAIGSRATSPWHVPVPLLLVMSYQPTVAAMLVAWATEGRTGVRSLLGGVLRWRVGLRWYLGVVLGPGLFWLAVVALAAWVNGRPIVLLAPGFAGWSAPKLVGSTMALLVITTVINGEEIGWRGFALPRLQARYSALTASLILGVPWGLFHLPLFWTVGSSQANQSILGFVAGTMMLAVIFTWVFNSTKSSILLAYLLHGSINTWTRILPVEQGGTTVLRIQTALTVILVIGLVARFGAAHLAAPSAADLQRSDKP